MIELTVYSPCLDCKAKIEDAKEAYQVCLSTVTRPSFQIAIVGQYQWVHNKCALPEGYSRVEFIETYPGVRKV